MSEAQYVDIFEPVNTPFYLQGNTAEEVRSSVIISPQQMQNNDCDETVVSSSSFKSEHKSFKYETQLLESTALLSETSSVNLMTVPKHITDRLKMRIQGSNFLQNQHPDKVLHVAKLELAFLLSKECVSFWNKYKTLQIMKDPVQKDTVFIAIQVRKKFDLYT